MNELLLKLQIVAWRSIMARHRRERRIETRSDGVDDISAAAFASELPSNIWLGRADNSCLRSQSAAREAK